MKPGCCCASRKRPLPRRTPLCRKRMILSTSKMDFSRLLRATTGAILAPSSRAAVRSEGAHSALSDARRIRQSHEKEMNDLMTVVDASRQQAAARQRCQLKHCYSSAAKPTQCVQIVLTCPHPRQRARGRTHFGQREPRAVRDGKGGGEPPLPKPTPSRNSRGLLRGC